MAEYSWEQIAIAIIAVILLAVTLIWFLKIYISEREGFSKENIECNYLSFIPFICSQEDLQKLQQPQQVQQLDIRKKNLLNHIVDLYQNCGENSPLQKCRCELNYALFKDKNLQLTISNRPNNIIKFSVDDASATLPIGKVYVDKIETAEEPARTGKLHTLVDVTIYNTGSIHLGYETIGAWLGLSEEKWYYVKIGDYKQLWRFSPPSSGEQGKIGILKEGDKKGLYIPYNGNFRKDNQETFAIPNYPAEKIPIC